MYSTSQGCQTWAKNIVIVDKTDRNAGCKSIVETKVQNYLLPFLCNPTCNSSWGSYCAGYLRVQGTAGRKPNDNLSGQEMIAWNQILKLFKVIDVT